VMYKDFVVDPWQVHDARACGADAVLLIARIQSPPQLRRLVEHCRELDMCALVECFDERDIGAALDSGAGVVGINNRDLGSFGVDFSRTERLRALLPDSVLAVAESGLTDRQALLRMQGLGFRAVLVGEALVSAPEPAQAVARLLGQVGPT
jgi:indole-3-glycerol phosphate synthase